MFDVGVILFVQQLDEADLLGQCTPFLGDEQLGLIYLEDPPI